MAAGSTYTPIATTTLGSAAASYTFSSIAGTYTDLILIATVQGDTVGMDLRFQFNGDTASNYSYTYLSGNGSSASSGRGSNSTVAFINPNQMNYTGGWDTNILQIQNYANTTTYKTAIARGSSAANAVNSTVNLWRSTSAINALKVIAAGGNFVAGSTFTLYGIAAA